MPARTKVVPIASGVGDLKFSGFSGPVEYRIEGEPARLKPGVARLRGCLTATAAIAEDAFKAGEALLVLATGELMRLTMLGHTEGQPQVYVELRV